MKTQEGALTGTESGDEQAHQAFKSLRGHPPKKILEGIGACGSSEISSPVFGVTAFPGGTRSRENNLNWFRLGCIHTTRAQQCDSDFFNRI
jgi:hypothetical protein